jgi:hypothetical protein
MAALATGVKQIYTIRDHKGNTARMVVYLSSGYNPTSGNAAATALGADIYAMQTGDTKLQPDGVTPNVQGQGYFTSYAQPWEGAFNSSGNYLTIEDKAVLVFQDTAGAVHRYQLPAPLESIFFADQETVDPTQVVVSQFIADMVHATFNSITPQTATLHPVEGADGTPLLKYVGGYRKRVKMRRRTNIFLKDPTLGIPEE